MTPKQNVYKVVLPAKGVMKSTIGFNRPDMALAYEIGRVTKPVDGSPIFVFFKLKDACEWAWQSYTHMAVILECEYEQEYPVQGVMASTLALSYKDEKGEWARIGLDEIWNKLRNFMDPLADKIWMGHPPIGTLLVTAVTPIRIVHDQRSEDASAQPVL